MFIDGLYVTRMTLHIYRDDEPIPREMRDEHISLELTQGQMAAIAAVLGLGYSHGNLLYYKDTDVRKNMEREDGYGVQALYHFIICNSRKDRMTKRVNTPLMNSQAGIGLHACKTDDGTFDFIMGETIEPETDMLQTVSDSQDMDFDGFSSDMLEDEDTSPAVNNDIMQQAATILGMKFSGMDDNDMGNPVDESRAAIQTGEPGSTDTPFSSR